MTAEKLNDLIIFYTRKLKEAKANGNPEEVAEINDTLNGLNNWLKDINKK